MDRLVDEGLILLGGPLEDEHEVLHVVRGESREAIQARLAEDNWTRNGMLETVSVEGWTILLDGLGLGSDPAGV
jgi:uncharacterized protein YciI